jgi:ubiquinone/menaquinone biosynthesis C-methylase UbiE
MDDSQRPEIQQKTASPFDNAAPFYDVEFEQSPATRRLRTITTMIFLRFFPAGSHLLELNCGTGTDAIELARNGMTVTATDASAAMLEQARVKVQGSGMRERITIEHLSFEELPRLKGRSFDGVYSNLGGLNCIPNVRNVGSSLASLVKPGSYVAACLLSPFCLWETAAFLLRGSGRRAFRRSSSSGSLATIHNTPVFVYYHSPDSVAEQFAPYFRKISVIGLNIFTPPPSSETAYRVLGKGRMVLERLDGLLAETFPFNRWGDHFLIVMERTDV